MTPVSQAAISSELAAPAHDASHLHAPQPGATPDKNRITGTPLACAQPFMSFRNFSPIGSNSAGDAIGFPR